MKITCWIQVHITAQLLIILRTILNMSCMKDPSWWLDDFYKLNRFWGHSSVKNELWIHWAQIWYIFKIWRWKWYKSTKMHKVWKFQSPMINNWTPGGKKTGFSIFALGSFGTIKKNTSLNRVTLFFFNSVKSFGFSEGCSFI